MTRSVLCALWLAGCAVGDTDVPSDDTAPVPIAVEIETGELVAVEEDPSICSVLPACGICSHLCDPDGFASQLPPGTCAAILCTLTDGRTVTAHACRN